MDLPASSLIETNDSPDDQEIKRIKLQIIDPCMEQLEQLDANIASLKTQLYTLQQKRSSLSLHIDRHRALIAPIRRLPRDVLREIFTRCLPTDHFALMKTTEAPLLLGRICSTWRQVAMTTPDLWTSIHIPYIGRNTSTPYFTASWEKRLEGISSWLSRSGTLPLSISCYFSPKTPDIAVSLGVKPDPSSMHSLFRLLLSVKSRWEHVDISTAARIYLWSLLNVDAASLYSLKSFSVRNNNSWQNPSCGILYAPHLRHLLIQPLDGQKQLPYRRLTSLSISFEDLGDSMAFYLPTIFTQCYNLIELTLLMKWPPLDSLVSAVPPPSFQRLQRLELDPDGVGLGLFTQSHMPELRHLKLRLDRVSDSPTVLRQFFGVLPPLHTLSLTLPWDSVYEILDGLRSQTELTELTLENMHKLQNAKRAKELIIGLTVGSHTDSVILPQLESFTHINSKVQDIYYKPFLLSRTAIAGDRSNTVLNNVEIAALKRVHIVSARSKVIDLLDDPEVSMACSASGLDLTVQYPKPHILRFSASSGLLKGDESHGMRINPFQFHPYAGAEEADQTDVESDDDSETLEY
ncbi:hypothetical protein AX16_009188 [Volvariella volvacea WC 439]|nr:hypothetical protein AX16_009188 [Volvariella volvacea WC 439]